MKIKANHWDAGLYMCFNNQTSDVFPYQSKDVNIDIYTTGTDFNVFFFIFSDLKFLIQMHLLESYYRLPYIQTCFMCHLFLRFLYKIIDLLFFDFAFCWRKLALNSSFYLTRWHDMWVKSRWLRTKLANHLRWNNWIWIVPLW